MGHDRKRARILPRGAHIAVAGLIILFVGSRAAAQPTEPAARLQAQLRTILTGHKQQRAVLSAHVVSLSNGRTLFEMNADETRAPASVMKMIVIAASLDRFGSGHKFVTRLAVTDHDLLVIGGGDPTLGDEKLAASHGKRMSSALDEWADALLKLNIRHISGGLLVDDSVFDATYVHPRWPADQYQDWYEAPIGGLNFADNCFDVVVTPDRQGGPAALSLRPPNGFVRMLNRTTRGGGKGGFSVRRSQDRSDVTVIGSGAKQVTLGPIAVNDPGLYFAGVLRSVLASRGIQIDGPTQRTRVFDDSGRPVAAFRVIARAETPITDAMQRAGHDSLGMMAEGLLKSLGAADGRRGSWATGTSAVRDFLHKLGASDEEFVLVDGSGLSRDNRISARTVTTVLSYMNRSRERDVFMASLAKSGETGTMKNRLRSAETRGRIIAKTGYIASVRTLAGYVRTRNDQWLAFAFLYNGASSTWQLTRAQDQACTLLTHWPDIPAMPTDPPPKKKVSKSGRR